MAKKVAFFIIGIIYTFLGFSFIYLGSTWWNQHVDSWVGYIVISFGLLCLIGSFFMRKGKPGGEASICPRCGTPFPEEREGTPCPKCGAALENMEGFYERHPERRSETMQGEYEAQDK